MVVQIGLEKFHQSSGYEPKKRYEGTLGDSEETKRIKSPEESMLQF